MVAKVEIYTSFACPYCYRAKNLLDDKGIDYVEIDVSGGGPRRGEMVARAPGSRTVPQIFIDDIAIGGSDDLYRLEQAGKLDAMLRSSADR